MSQMRVSRRARGLAVAGVCVALVLVSLGTFAAQRERGDRAYADEVRAEMARAYRGAARWRAHVVEREANGEGGPRTIRHDIVVVAPDRYTVRSVETNEEGTEVVSVTAREGSTVRSTTRIGEGPPHVLEIRNVPPELGAFTDNILGQHVRDLARATGMRYAGRDTVGERAALKLEVEPGRLVWVDATSALPLREQLLSEGQVVHEIEVVHLEMDVVDLGDPELAAAEPAPANVEDLGFRAADPASAPHSLLGFMPRRVAAPSTWRLVVSGYTEPVAHADGAPDAPAWIARYDTPDGPVLITQSKGGPAGPVFDDAADGTLGPALTQVGGRTVGYYEDDWRTHATTHVGDVRVSVEGLMAAEDLLPAVGYLQ